MFQIKSTTIFGGDQGVKTELISASVHHDLSLGGYSMTKPGLSDFYPAFRVSPCSFVKWDPPEGEWSQATRAQWIWQENEGERGEDREERRRGKRRGRREPQRQRRQICWLLTFFSSFPWRSSCLPWWYYLLLCLVSIFWNCLSNII